MPRSPEHGRGKRRKGGFGRLKDKKTSTPQLTWDERPVEGIPAIALSGRLDIDTAPDLRTALMRHVKRRTPKILVDMSGLEFMDSGGLATLIEAELTLRQHDGQLVLFGLAPQITEVFSLTQAQGMFAITETEDEAVEAVG
jgi:anti-sigma B factor antagonist